MASSLASTLKDPALFADKAYIDGKWVASKSNQTFEVRNPATDEVIGTCPESNVEDLNAAIEAAANAFPAWRAQSGRQRGRILRRLFELIVENKEDIGKIITAENGKAKGDAEGEALFTSGFFEWFAEEAPRIYGDVVPHSNPTHRTQIVKQPVGVCGLITPWNFPIAMGARKVAAALAAGCTIVLKSDGVTPYSSNVLAVLAERAGLPKGVLNVVTALNNTPQLGVALCESDTVKKISFTGSTRVGKILMQQSSSTLKKLSLELGGNAPFIVFDDADLELAVTSAVIAKFKVTGQTCVCANRIYVQEGIYDEFSRRLVEEVKKFRVGPGSDASSTHGPLTTSVDKVEEHVKDAVSKKGTVLLGGNRLPSLGKNFYELTVLGDCDDSMKVMNEETFGPLAALTKFKTEEEVIKRANSVEVGLASYLMTSNLGTYQRVSERLDFGMVEVLTCHTPPSSLPCTSIKSKKFPANAINCLVVNVVPRRVLGIPRKYVGVTVDHCHQIMESSKPHHSVTYQHQSKLCRNFVVKCGLAGTGNPHVTYPLADVHWGSKVRGICFYAVTAVVAVFLFMLMLVVHPFVLLFDQYRRKAHHLIAKLWATLAVSPFFKVEFKGLQNLPASDTAAVYVSNHQSFLDIYTFLMLGRSFKFISKTAIFVFPVIGWAMLLMGIIPLKRMDSRSQLECLRRCMDLVRKGASVFFFPEGTRSKDGKLGIFKKGAFSVAAKTGVPVVPITVMGTGNLMPSGREGMLNWGSVEVIIHKPIEGSNAEILCNKARNAIADALVC